MEFYKEFDKDKCTLCGLCLHECPVMRLPLEEAKAQMERLVRGEDARSVLTRCESCFTCDYVCPENAHPAGLFLRRWEEAYKNGGLPRRAKYFLPLSVPNFRTFAIDRLPENERSMLRSWLDESPAEEIFYPGCNWITAPYLAKSRLLEGYTIRGSLAYCCGEMYFRMGLHDQLRKLSARLKAWLGRMGVKRMVIPCTAGNNLFTNVLPRFGFDYPLEVEHLLPILQRRIESGDIKIEKKLDMTVTIQESCHAKALGPEFMDLPRTILARLGVEIIEEERSRDKMICCGIGGGFSHPSSYNPARLTFSTWRALGEARRTGAQAIATYCAGCAQMLTTGQITNPFNRMPVYHVFELVRMAAGEETISRSEKLKRAAYFLAGVTGRQGPALLDPRRFRLDEVPEVLESLKY